MTIERSCTSLRMLTIQCVYESALKPTWWHEKLLQRCLIAFAKYHNLESVRAFASATSSYRNVLERVGWREASIDDAILLTPQAVPGGVRKSPASIGEALVALNDGILTTTGKVRMGYILIYTSFELRRTH